MGIFKAKVVRSTSGKALPGRPNPKIRMQAKGTGCTSASERRRGKK